MYQDDPALKRGVLRKLFAYTLPLKKNILFALLILMLAVGAQLVGPYIAKVIIDKHILSIENTWYMTEHPTTVPTDIHSVEIDNVTYIREDWVKQGGHNEGWQVVDVQQSEGDFRVSLQDGTTLLLSSEDVLQLYQHDIQPVILLLAIFLAFLLISGVLSFCQSYMFHNISLTIIQRFRMDVMRHIHQLPIRYFDQTPAGQLVSRISNDTEAIKELFNNFLSHFLVSGMNLIGIYVALFILDVRLALLCLLLIPIFVFLAYIHLRLSKVYVARIRARMGDLNAKLNESISVMPILQAFGREEQTIDEFHKVNHDRYWNQVKLFRIFGLSARNMTNFLMSVTAAGALWYFGGQSLEQVISLGVLYAFINYLTRMIPQIVGVFDQIVNAQQAVVSAERVFALMNREIEPNYTASPEVAQTSAIEKTRIQGSIQFDHVDFSYNGEGKVLRNIDFEAKPGQTIAFVGHTGSGKSSIMNLLLGFYEAQSGTIRIDGRDIRTMSKQQLREQIGIVLQDPFLFTGDIQFNVSLYNDQIDENKVKQALHEVGASSFIERLPNRYQEAVVEKGSMFSSGQRQLISFARALAYDPPILILDEATSSIDSETEQIIQHALQVLSKGRTTFIIAHRLSTIREADLILVLHRGEIVERGTHDELMQLQGRYYRMYQLQMKEAI